MASTFFAATTLFCALAAAAQYDEYILAPSSRTIHPVKVYQVNTTTDSTVQNAESILGDSVGNLIINGSATITYDFGKNIGGLVTLQIGDVDADQFIGLTYTESSQWISSEGSDATQDAGIDEAIWFQPTGPGNLSVSREHERGGFRYLSLLHNTTASIEVQQISVYFTPMPHWQDDQLRDYTGYFHCDDELLNRIWYAGAYTNQMCTIDPQHGNSLVHPELNSSMPNSEVGTDTWFLNYTISNASSALSDGAKRDRLIWPGDMSIAVPSIVVSTNDLVTIASSLDSLFSLQNKSTGQLPYAGVPFNERGIFSATYHLYSLIGLADYYLYSGDLPYVQNKWTQWVSGLNYSLSTIDSSNLMNVTSSADWLRFGMGGHNIEANSILYYTINQGLVLGQAVGADDSLLDLWAQKAAAIKAAANNLLWNQTAGLYHDNETTTLQPQDGNSWAVVSKLTDSESKNNAISAALANRWTAFGAPAVEAANAVSPFISGFELQMHMLAGNASAALALMRLEWGFMMNDPRMTNSTFIEGYSADGSLHYAPYTNDPRVSHAHGWATGPTSTLTFYVAGIHLLSEAGREWEIAPMLGDLMFVDAGFETPLGTFSSQINASSPGGGITGMKFSTPVGTIGSVRGVTGTLVSSNGSSISMAGGVASNVPGGNYTLVTSGNGTSSTGSGNGTYASGNASTTTGSMPPAYSGNSAAKTQLTSGVFVAVVLALVL